MSDDSVILSRSPSDQSAGESSADESKIIEIGFSPLAFAALQRRQDAEGVNATTLTCKAVQLYEVFTEIIESLAAGQTYSGTLTAMSYGKKCDITLKLVD